MQKLKAILTLIRLPNLVFIFLTQLLAYYFLIKPCLNQQQVHSSLANPYLFILTFSTVLIAAAGYIINDYFDIGIDAINKPERVTIEKIFKRRTIIIWHIVLNILAVSMAAYVAYYVIQLRYVGLQLLSIFLLLVYSTTFKRKLITGNFIISILTALTLLSIAAYEPSFPLFNLKIYYVKMYWVYILFAFLITFCREVVKDIEDIKGDDVQHCKTIPIVWGIQTAKNFVFALIGILLLLLIIMSVRYYDADLILVMYWLVLLIFPLLFICYKLRLATNAVHFHQLSSLIKWITLAGILSMIFI